MGTTRTAGPGRHAWTGLLLLALAACGGGGGTEGPTTCRSIMDCDPGLICLSGVCARPAVSDGAGTTCRTDADCPSATPVCRSGTCTAPDAGGTCSCEDEDECTATAPECRLGTECTADADCADEEDCTLNTCRRGLCALAAAPVDDCCVAATDCDDALECSVDQCVYFHCEHQLPAGCCESDAQCADTDPCTEDRCTPSGCTHASLGEGCCTADDDCDDDESCTRDVCVEGRCVHPRTDPDPRCGCLNAGQCDDGNTCTRETCDDQRCAYAAADGGGCCAGDDGCDDGRIETFDVCRESVCSHLERRTCTADEECDGAIPCYETSCYEGRCVEIGSRIEGCCASAVECDDGDACTLDTCLPSRLCRHEFQLVLTAGCCQNDAHCDDGLACTAEYCCRADSCAGGGVSVAFQHCAYTVVSGDGCCRGNADCDDDLPCTLDVCVNGGCEHVSQGTCCQLDTDCDDGDTCTRDRCEEAACLTERVSGCCHSTADCDDGNACTTDACDGETCAHVTIPGCCNTDLQCDDDDVCTRDFCAAGECQHQHSTPCCDDDATCTSRDPCRQGRCRDADCIYMPVSGCCHDAADCDDRDGCTQDFCAGSACQHLPSQTPECCTTTWLYQNDFESGAFALLDGWTVQNTVTGLGWEASNAAPAHAGSWTLHYDYGTGQSHTGRVRSPEWTLPDPGSGRDVFLGFFVALDLDPSPFVDTFEVRIVQSGQATTLWSKSALGGTTGGEYRFVSLDLGNWRGSRVQIEFELDTVVIPTVARGGVSIDDFQLGSGCQLSPVECQIDLDCVDNDPCTFAICIDQSCATDAGAGPSCCDARPFAATFDDGTLQGFSTSFLHDPSPVAWTPVRDTDGGRAFTPPYALYFGNPATHTYADGTKQVGGRAETGDIDLSGLTAPLLSFQLHLAIDHLVVPDDFRVVIVDLVGGGEHVVWSTDEELRWETEGAFELVTVSLATYSRVRIRFEFDTSDGWGAAEGVYVDDVVVGEDCPGN